MNVLVCVNAHIGMDQYGFPIEFPPNRGGVFGGGAGGALPAIAESGYPNMPFPSAGQLASHRAVPYSVQDVGPYNMNWQTNAPISQQYLVYKDPNQDSGTDLGVGHMVFASNDSNLEGVSLPAIRLKTLSGLNYYLYKNRADPINKTAERILATWKFLGGVMVMNPLTQANLLANQFVIANVVIGSRFRSFNYWYEPYSNAEGRSANSELLSLWLLLVKVNAPVTVARVSRQRRAPGSRAAPAFDEDAIRTRIQGLLDPVVDLVTAVRLLREDAPQLNREGVAALQPFAEVKNILHHETLPQDFTEAFQDSVVEFHRTIKASVAPVADGEEKRDFTVPLREAAIRVFIVAAEAVFADPGMQMYVRGLNVLNFALLKDIIKTQARDLFRGDQAAQTLAAEAAGTAFDRAFREQRPIIEQKDAANPDATRAPTPEPLPPLAVPGDIEEEEVEEQGGGRSHAVYHDMDAEDEVPLHRAFMADGSTARDEHPGAPPRQWTAPGFGVTIAPGAMVADYERTKRAHEEYEESDGGYWQFKPYCCTSRDEPPMHLYIRPDQGWVGHAIRIGTSHWIHNNPTHNIGRVVSKFTCPRDHDSWTALVDKLPQLDVLIGF